MLSDLDESLRQVDKEYVPTQEEQCRILFEELGLEKYKTVSPEMKYKIAKQLKPEFLCAFEEFKPRHPLYQQISTILAKIYYCDKSHRSVLPTE